MFLRKNKCESENSTLSFFKYLVLEVLESYCQSLKVSPACFDISAYTQVRKHVNAQYAYPLFCTMCVNFVFIRTSTRGSTLIYDRLYSLIIVSSLQVIVMHVLVHVCFGIFIYSRYTGAVKYCSIMYYKLNFLICVLFMVFPYLLRTIFANFLNEFRVNLG